MRIIYHLGTGIWFDMNDDVYVIDTTDIDLDASTDFAEMLDEEGEDIALTYGEKVLTYGTADETTHYRWR